MLSRQYWPSNLVIVGTGNNVKKALPFILFLAVIELTACGSDDGGCTVDYDCPGLEICVQKACVPFVCKVDADCVDPAMICQENSCVPGTTTPPADTSTPPADTSTPPADTSTPPADTSAPPTDQGQDTSDAQEPTEDSVQPPADGVDAGEPSGDTAQSSDTPAD